MIGGHLVTITEIPDFHRVTEIEGLKHKVETVNGLVTYEKWCKAEAARIKKIDGRTARVGYAKNYRGTPCCYVEATGCFKMEEEE